MNRRVRAVASLLGVVGALAVAAPTPARASAEMFTADMSGEGSGFAVLYLNESETQMTLDMFYSAPMGSDVIDAHIYHVGFTPAHTVTGLPPDPGGPVPTQTFAVTPAQVADFRAGLASAEVAHITGYISGNFKIARNVFDLPPWRMTLATLNGAREVPPNASSATGKATVYVNWFENEVTVDMRFAGLGTNATAAHIHCPAGLGVNAGIAFALSGVPPATSGAVPTQTFAITPARLADLKAGLCYLNVHSSALPNGEIRAQLLRAQSLPMVVQSSTTWWSAFSIQDNPFAGQATFGTKPLAPTAGDWDGDGTRTAGVFSGGTFTPASPAFTAGTPFAFGDPRGFPVGGDYNGDGVDDLAIYRNGTWQVRLSTGATSSFSFGTGSWPATVPVAGDWNGDGTDGVGTYTRSTATFSLRNSASTGPAEITSVLGTPNASYPVVGDWTHDGIDNIGVKSTAGPLWTLDDNLPHSDFTFNFGLANDLPLTWR
jgi:hypothetical protein